MNKFKTVFLGVSIGCIIFTLSAIVFADNDTKVMAIGSIAIGLAFGISSLIHDSERFSLLTKTLIQLFAGITTFFTVAYFCEWFPFTPGPLITAIIIFLVIFFIIWFIMYLVEKKRTDLINEKIK